MSSIRFAFAKRPAPLLNTPDFETAFNHLPIDEHNLLRCVETVALPGTKLHILENTTHPYILKVSTSEYPYDGTFYTDERLLEPTDANSKERSIVLPAYQDILKDLEDLIGVSYIWGGNWPEGIFEMKEFYPEASDPSLANTKLLKGVDCTGLLYFVTKGYTPRNTSKFVAWQESVPIAGLSINEILMKLKPLDAIVWRGHLVIVYDPITAIESRLGYGVIKTPLKERLEEICATRQPADKALPDCFVVRRWHQNV